MSGFQNRSEMNTNTYPAFSYNDPNLTRINPLWMDGASHNLRFPGSYVPTGYHQPGEMVYPLNVLQNSPGFGSHVNLNHLANLPLQNSLLNSGNVLFQSTPNLTNTIPLASALANNSHFIHYNLHNQGEQMMPQTVTQVVPTAYGISYLQIPVSLADLNISNQQQEMWLQQHFQQQQKLQQQEHLQTPNQQSNEAPFNNGTYIDTWEGSNNNISGTPNQNVTTPPNQDVAKIPNQTEIVPLNQNVTIPPIQNILKTSNQSVADTQTENSMHSASTSGKAGPFYTGTVHPASPSTYVRNYNHSRPNMLPSSFPTSLNPSLQIKNKTNLLEVRHTFQKPDQKSSSHERDVSLNAVKEVKVEIQGEQGTPEKNPSLLSSGTIQSAVSSQLAPPDYGVIKPIYDKPKNKDHCLRCGKKVYPMERTHPIKEVIYHKNCFTCVTCGSILNLKNFHHNSNDTDDLSIFCISHKPKERTRSCDTSAVHIKRALVAPKLDKVNEQIRSDRQPSEVLNRSGYSQPAASALSTAREHFYYGMQVAEGPKPDQTHQSQRNQTQQLQHEEQRHQQLEQQEQYEPLQEPQHQEQQQEIHEPQEQDQPTTQLPEPSDSLQHQVQQIYQQQYNQLFQQNVQLQQQILENEEALINGAATITVAEEEERNNPHVKFPAQTDDAQRDDVFTSNDKTQIHSANANNGHNKKSSSSSLSSSLSSAIMHQEISSEESLDDYLSTHFKLGNHATLDQHKQHLLNNSGVHTFIEREHISSTSSRSASPMQTQNGSRSTDDNESRRSSFSSNLSSRDSVDLGVSAVSYSGHQQLAPSHLQRADRPSSGRNTPTFDASSKKNLSARMLDFSKISYNIEVPNRGAELDRVLPMNERMRMDRPSQYS